MFNTLHYGILIIKLCNVKFNYLKSKFVSLSLNKKIFIIYAIMRTIVLLISWIMGYPILPSLNVTYACSIFPVASVLGPEYFPDNYNIVIINMWKDVYRNLHYVYSLPIIEQRTFLREIAQLAVHCYDLHSNLPTGNAPMSHPEMLTNYAKLQGIKGDLFTVIRVLNPNFYT